MIMGPVLLENQLVWEWSFCNLTLTPTLYCAPIPVLYKKKKKIPIFQGEKNYF
jgi:hypothetical protein